jgi:hypothetical protein
MSIPNPGRLPFLLFHAGFTGMAIALQKMLLMVNPKPERRAALRFFRNAAALRGMRWSGDSDYPVYVMNRLRDRARLERFRATCRRWGIRFERVDGIDLRETPGLLRPHAERIADLCYNRPDFVRGIYGCFLAHRQAWLRLQDTGAEWALICEDDARFLGPIPKRIADYGIPPGTDLVFANLRMAEGLLHLDEEGPCVRGGFRFVPAAEALRKLLEVSPHLVAPGGDGYLLSRAGAGKLLDAFDQSRMAFDVDWFMLFQSLDDVAMGHFLEVDRTGRFDGHRPHPARLRSLVMVPSLVEQAEGESKVRRMEFCPREALFQ